MGHHVRMPYHWDRLASGIQDARGRLGITQEELARRSKVDLSTIKNLEGRHVFSRWPKTIGAVEQALGKPEGWARALAEGRPLPAESDEPSAATPEDGFVQELRDWPGLSDQMRERLIAAYIQNRRERMEAAAAAAERLVRPLAEAAARGERDEPDQGDYPESTAS
jgi:transcriptional regulator with XRE-family HTH domain